MSDQKEALQRAIEARKQELYDLLSSLIRFDTQNFGFSGREENLVPFLSEYMRGLDMHPDVYSPMEVPGLKENPDYWDGHHLENRYNVTGMRKGTGGRRLMLAAHADTVPIGDRENWTVDPLSGEQRDGKIWGRGACDDKYGIAAALFLLRLLKDAGVTLPYDLYFTAYCDEEHGGSNGALASCLKYPCDDIVNLDCKNFQIWAAAVGGGVLKAGIRSEEPLDSCGRMLDGLLIVREEFERMKERRAAELSAIPLFRDTVIPRTSVRFGEFRAGDGSADKNHAYALVTFFTTLDREAFDRELEDVATRIDERLRPLGMRFDSFRRTTRHFLFGETQLQDNPVLDALIRAGAECAGEKLTPCGSCLSDLSVFLKYGSPRAFSFGAGRDFDAYGGAHQTDEYIGCESLLKFTKILGTFLLNCDAQRI